MTFRAAAVLCLILHLTVRGAECLRGMQIRIPEAAVSGSTVTLGCDYDLEQAALYTIKWYIGDDEFYRFVPKESPPSRVFPMPHVNVDKYRDERVARVDRFDVCYVAPDPPYILHYFLLRQLPNKHYSFSTSAEVLEEMHGKDLMVEIEAFKCKSRELLDSCEKFIKYRPQADICTLIRIKELGVRSVMDQFKPPIRCPIQKINYSLDDATYDYKQFTLFPLGNNYWKAYAYGYFKKRLVGKVCLEAQTFM